MSYSSLIRRLFNVNVFGGSKLGLKNVQRLQQLLKFPDRAYTSIHVAGTNGKGSVATKIAFAFEQAGYRVGLYTSPHLCCFRERIRINGQMISEKDVEKLLTDLFSIVNQEQLPATFFELTTFLAFLYFAQEKVDIAVLETGLGGRLDATNIVIPCLSVITSISLDHTDILGETREAITKEKGGIIKEKIPVIIGPHVPLEPIQEIAHQQQSPCIQVKQTSLLFDEENCWIARAALEYLAGRFLLSPKAIALGLTSKPPCRFEVVEGSPRTILDVAHNPDGLQHLFQAIKMNYPGCSIRLLFGLSSNKDLKKCLHVLTSNGEHFHLVEASNGRGAPLEILRARLLTFPIDSESIFMHKSISTGVRFAKQEAHKHRQMLVICGSFFIMGHVRQTLGFRDPQDVVDLNERYFVPNLNKDILSCHHQR